MSLTRRLILQKARHHPTTRRALTACRHTVSGTLSLPSRGTFHHSLTVLSAIGHQEVFRLTGWSRQIHSRFHGPAATREITQTGMQFSPTGLSPSTADHPRPLPLTTHFLTALRPGRTGHNAPTTPHTQPLPGHTCARFSHPPRSLATTNGITLVFFSYGY
jgi:hypothetical protein